MQFCKETIDMITKQLYASEAGLASGAGVLVEVDDRSFILVLDLCLTPSYQGLLPIPKILQSALPCACELIQNQELSSKSTDKKYLTRPPCLPSSGLDSC